MANIKTRKARYKRHQRVRQKICGTSTRPRLCVFRSLNHIYAQIIDDSRGHTLVSASTLDAEMQSSSDGKSKKDRAGVVGQLLAKRAVERGINEVAFDRGGYKYHGRIKALADAAREGGLKF
jgi:large subunit ribosomal protein L18